MVIAEEQGIEGIDANIPELWDYNDMHFNVEVYDTSGRILKVENIYIEFQKFNNDYSKFLNTAREDFTEISREYTNTMISVTLKPKPSINGSYKIIIGTRYGSEMFSKEFKFSIGKEDIIIATHGSQSITRAYMKKLVEKIANKITGDATKEMTDSEYKSYVVVGILVLLSVCICSFGLYKHFKHKGKSI
jgi:hypothetical protein